MRNLILRAGAAGLAALSVSDAAPASAHAVVGNRFFPATLATDDPGVADELSLPTLSSARSGGDPSTRQLDVSGEYAKRLTDRLGISVGEAWTRLKTSGEPTSHGFQNIETTLKYQVLASARHEALLSTGLSVEWADSGAARVGAEHHATFTPTIYFGKGAGDLPESLAWARPFAVTGLVGYAVPSRARDGLDRNPTVLRYGLAVEYSLPYLVARVRDLGLPEVINHLTPIVEASFATPVAQAGGARTTGEINPGVIWSGRRFQLGAEAILPINRESGRGVGLRLQAHFYLDDLFPGSVGKPVW